MDLVKDSEIEAIKIGNKRLVDGNKALKADLKEVAKEFHLSKFDSTPKLERQIQVLKTRIL